MRLRKGAVSGRDIKSATMAAATASISGSTSPGAEDTRSAAGGSSSIAAIPAVAVARGGADAPATADIVPTGRF